MFDATILYFMPFLQKNNPKILLLFGRRVSIPQIASEFGESYKGAYPRDGASQATTPNTPALQGLSALMRD